MASFPRIDLSKLTNIELPTFDLSAFDLSRFELPTFDMPNVELPNVEQVTAFARDAAYVGVGLAVATVEQLQALQQQLVELVKSSASTIVERVRDAV